jgi:hypothetical protein
MNRVRLDRLHLRLKGVSSEAARAMVEGLGHHILQLVAQKEIMPGSRVSRYTAAIDAGVARSRRGSSVEHSRQMVARRVAGVIADQASGRSSES